MFLSAIVGVILENFIEARSFFYFGLLIVFIGKQSTQLVRKSKLRQGNKHNKYGL